MIIVSSRRYQTTACWRDTSSVREALSSRNFFLIPFASPLIGTVVFRVVLAFIGSDETVFLYVSKFIEVIY